MALIYPIQPPRLSQRIDFMANNLDLTEGTLHPLTFALCELSRQPQPGLDQSFDYHDSDLLSPSYIGPLIEAAVDRVLPLSNHPELSLAVPKNYTAVPDTAATDFRFDQHPGPVVPVEIDEIALRPIPTTEFLTEPENPVALNTVHSLPILYEIADTAIGHELDEKKVVKTDNSGKGEQATKTHKPYTPDWPASSDIRKFRRNNQVVVKGNNRVGKKGKRRCTECRKIHSKCVRNDGSDACNYCQLRGRKCVMTWGAEKEKELALAKGMPHVSLSRQLPTANDALIAEDEGWRLNWLFHHLPGNPFGQVLQNMLAVYGPTISCPPLRLAILANAEFGSPYEKRYETFILRSVRMGSQKPVSDLDEGDLIATFLLVSATRWANFGQRRLQDKIPSRSTHLKRILELMKKLVQEASGNISRYAFGQHWLVFLAQAVANLPSDCSHASVWELLQLVSRLIDIYNFTTWSMFGDPNSSQPLSPADVWMPAIVHHSHVIMIGFWALLQNGDDGRLPENEAQRTILRDTKLALSAIESSEIHQQIGNVLDHTGIDKFLPIPAEAFGGARTYLTVWMRLRHLYAADLLATLMLDADNILQSAILPQAAFHASRLALEVSHSYDPRVTRDLRISAHNILHAVVASLVHPVSQVTEVRNAIMTILSFARPWVGDTVQKYWLNPELRLGKMLALLRSIWKTVMQMEGMSGDFEEGGQVGVQFWNCCD